MGVEMKRDYRKENIRTAMGRCVHFTGLHAPGGGKRETCDAGVRYDDVTVRHEPMPYLDRWGREYTSGKSLPCLGGSHNLAGATCSKRRTLTREEAEAKQREREQWIKDMGVARKAIVATGLGSGSIPCPKCGTGALHFSRARVNGHVHARCSTDGCLAWME